MEHPLVAIEQPIQRARERAEREQTAVNAKAKAIGQFRSRVEAITPTSSSAGTAQAMAGATSLHTSASHGNHSRGCTAVREAFAETVAPQSTADIDKSEPLILTIREELGEAVALALSERTDTQFTPPIKRAVLTETQGLRTETRVLQRAIETERESLDHAQTEVALILSQIAEANNRSLLGCTFSELRSLHEELSELEDQCEAIAANRQSTIQTTTSHNAAAGLTHQAVLGYLYGSSDTQYPVLTTVCRVVSICRESKRAVRDHLCRRI
ncbi:DUF7260 family protein [Halalkalirubrum salinum]|uniref:DUF7260 family protein n=1 Tax=Halalkalirubrum salinum TaxID=2563889 RepID=UPI0010FB8E65|nr:hypothetical protein [Halalkalirubrum salinum]